LADYGIHIKVEASAFFHLQENTLNLFPKVLIRKELTVFQVPLDVAKRKKEEKEKSVHTAHFFKKPKKFKAKFCQSWLKGWKSWKKRKNTLIFKFASKCNSPFIRQVGNMGGDTSAHIGFAPPTFECGECGWRGKTMVKATNKPTALKDVVIVEEANDAVKNRAKRKDGLIIAFQFFSSFWQKILLSYRLSLESIVFSNARIKYLNYP
jgi:hypothetical protein